MSNLDVTQLADESMPGDAFPASLKADFRFFIDDQVHQAIHAHAAEDTKIEICGVIVGLWKKDDDGPYATITDYIRCDNASSEMTEVTFTHESWAHINSEMDSKYEDKRIVGWYHSHPDFGIFLSDRDVFIQEHFFSGAGQVALVVDPVRKLEGVFEWRAGKPELMKHYWAGNDIVTIAQSRSPTSAERKAAASQPASASMPATGNAVAPVGATLPGPSITTLLAWVCLFLLGYLVAGYRSSWERELMETGAVARYGLFNISAYGLGDNLTLTSNQIGAIREEVIKLGQEHIKLLKGDEQKAARKRWMAVRDTLSKNHKILEAIAKTYSVTDQQKQTQALVIYHKLAEMYGAREAKRMLPPNFPIPNSNASGEPKDETGKAKNDKPDSNKTSTKPDDSKKSNSKSKDSNSKSDGPNDKPKPGAKPSVPIGPPEAPK